MGPIGVAVLAASFTCAMERVDSMDPVKAQSMYDARAVQLVYETPLQIDYKARPYRLVPGLCELPEVSGDGLVYVFRMVACAPVGSGDVKRAIERLRDPANPSPGSWTMRRVASVETPDPATLRVTLDARQHVFPWMLAMGYAGVRLADGSGTGPYRLKSWWRNHEMTFVRNESWRGWRDNDRPFDVVRYLVVDDASTRWLMFLKGEIDCLAEIDRDNWDAVIGRDGKIVPSLAAKGVALRGGTPALEMRYIGFNVRDPVLSNANLRRALSCAFDSGAWKAFYNNGVLEATGPVPPCVEGFLDTPFEYAYDLEKAKALLAKAGYPGGMDPATGRRLVLTLSIGRATQDSREAGELVASFFDRIGVKLELGFQTWEAFLAAVNRGETQMHMMGWVGDYPDAENFLQLFHTKNFSPGPNHSFYSSAAFDAEYDAAMASTAADERNAHWRRCQEIVREDCPWIYTHVRKNYTLVRDRVKNYVVGDFPYGCERHLRTED